MALTLESIGSNALSLGGPAGREIKEIVLADSTASGTSKQTITVPLGKTYRSIKPLAAVGSTVGTAGTTFQLGVTVPDLSSVIVESTTAASVTGTKVYVTLECKV